MLSRAAEAATDDASDFVAAAGAGADDGRSPDELRKQIDDLTARLEQYRRLDEDLMAQRVFVKARRQLIGWITLGGVVAFVVGFVGFRQVEDYTKHLVSTKVQALTDAEVKRTVVAEGDKEMALVVRRQQSQMQTYWTQRINEVVALFPIKARHGASAVSATAVTATPSQSPILDDSAHMTPVRDQGSEGSVVGFAVAAALEYQIWKRDHRTVVISPRWIYYYAEKDGGSNPHADNGATVSQAVEVVATRGAVPEAAWPYESGERALAADPPRGTAAARRYRVRLRARLHGVGDIKAALQQYGPVVVGISVYQSMMAAHVAQTGYVPDPKPNDSILGGHAVCIVGYDDMSHRFKFKNSWGPAWGDHGYGTLSYDYVRKYASDAWALVL